MSVKEQKLIDICFQIGLIMSDKQYNFINLTVPERAEYIAKQLRECGFNTIPCGASWGVLQNT